MASSTVYDFDWYCRQPPSRTNNGWLPISIAPTDGTEVWVYVAPRDGLKGFQCVCAYHPDAGWCADELRHVTYWRPLPPPPKDKP